MTLSANCADGVISHSPWGPSPQTPRCLLVALGGWLGLAASPLRVRRVAAPGSRHPARRFACAASHIPRPWLAAQRAGPRNTQPVGRSPLSVRGLAVPGPWLGLLLGLAVSGAGPCRVRLVARSVAQLAVSRAGPCRSRIVAWFVAQLAVPHGEPSRVRSRAVAGPLRGLRASCAGPCRIPTRSSVCCLVRCFALGALPHPIVARSGDRSGRFVGGAAGPRLPVARFAAQLRVAEGSPSASGLVGCLAWPHCGAWPSRGGC